MIDSTDIIKSIEIFKECKNYSDHNFVPYKVGTVRCTKRGKFAKLGYLTPRGGNE